MSYSAKFCKLDAMGEKAAGRLRNLRLSYFNYLNESDKDCAGRIVDFQQTARDEEIAQQAACHYAKDTIDTVSAALPFPSRAYYYTLYQPVRFAAMAGFAGLPLGLYKMVRHTNKTIKARRDAAKSPASK